MSVGLDIAGVVLAGINIAHLAVIAYQEARPGRTAGSLHRKLKNEKAIYEQFLGRFLGPYMSPTDITKLLDDQAQDPQALMNHDLLNKMRRRMGNETLDLVLESLAEMEVLLKALGTELKNMTDGTVSDSCKPSHNAVADILGRKSSPRSGQMLRFESPRDQCPASRETSSS